MVRVTGPCYSLSARGWLGGDMYGHNQYRPAGWVAPKGLVLNPYPIALVNPYLMSSMYYSRLGWCYQMRRTWHGIIWAAIRPPISAQPKTVAQEAWKSVFADAVAAWQALTGLEKGIWNNYSHPRVPAGYGRFISAYLKDKPGLVK